jgi:ferrous iron transport protein B
MDAAGQHPNAPATPRSDAAAKYVVLTGNPNCGKTTLFNSLTGLRAKVGNYAGVTVERKEGKLLHAPGGTDIRLIDLPGTYSLSPQSLDEEVSRDVLLNRLPELPMPAAVVVVVDASNLQRNLYYTTQVLELGYPTVVALNMIDVAQENGHEIDSEALAEELGVPVVPLVASTGEGLADLRVELEKALQPGAAFCQQHFGNVPPAMVEEARQIAVLLEDPTHTAARTQAEALLILGNEKALSSSLRHFPEEVSRAVTAARERLERAGVDWRGVAIENRYARVSEIQARTTRELGAPGETFSDKLDRYLTHKIWGTVAFVLVMALMFQSIFTFAHWPMDLLQTAVDWVGELVTAQMPPGELRSLLVDGVVAGVGAVVVFLPQILLLFMFIGFLEDTGYMARAAFLMDRLMSKVGLHGKSFIPMLSSFACAIPGIMATRTIESPKDRLTTILVAPLMSCSARLPVYTLLIAACIPNLKVLGFLKLQGLTMLGMYLLGIVVALAMAWLFKKTLLKGEPPLLIMELPPYKRPVFKVVMRHMWDRSKLFLRRAGTIILGINILLWFLATYPHSGEVEKTFELRRSALTTPGTPGYAEATIDKQLADLRTEESGEKLRHSFAGWLGRAIEPVIAPLGFDWKIGIGIVTSFAAREVFVSTMSTVYNVGAGDNDGNMNGLVDTLREQKRPDGSPVYTPLTGLTLMVFYVFALQCVSTVAVVRRETNSWKWPFFQWFYMGVLAWIFAFVVYQGGKLLGWG